MPARPRPVFDGRIYCGSHCGRLLPVSHFYLNGRGDPNSACKDCHRVEARERYRRRHRVTQAAWRAPYRVPA